MSRSTLLRQWALLQLIPRHSYRSTAELHERLTEQGFEVNKRTVERDLAELELLFPLDSRKDSKPYGWRWSSVHDGVDDQPGDEGQQPG